MLTIKKFFSNESGATAIEYALIASLIGVGIIVGLQTLKNKLSGTFSNVGARL